MRRAFGVSASASACVTTCSAAIIPQKWAHLQSSVSHYPKILHNLNMKNGRSDTPLS